MLCLDGIGRESERVELKGESLRKSINFAYDTEDQQRTERISLELVNGYRPEYAIEIIKMLANGHTLTMNKVFVLLKINNNRI